MLEKERAFSWTIRNYYHKGKEVMAEPHDVALEATLPHWDTSREELLGAWQELVDQYRVDIRYQHNVHRREEGRRALHRHARRPEGQADGPASPARAS